MIYFFNIKPVLLGFKSHFFIWVLLSISVSAWAQSNSGEKLLQSKEIRIKKSEMLNLFSAISGEKRTIHFVTVQGVQNMEVWVLNHQNVGEKSGAIAAMLVLEKSDARLLINRKLRNGKLIYWMAILPSKGEMAFKLKDESADEFVLVQVSKNEVVTE